MNFKNAILDLVDNGKILSDNNGKAKAFMFFKSAFKKELECFPDFNLNAKSSIEHVSFPADKIKEKPDNLNPCKSTGADGLHPRILKELSNELSLSLSLSQNHSVKENYLKTRRMLVLLNCIKKEKKSLPATIDQIVLLLLFAKSWNQSLKMISLHTWLVTSFQMSNMALFMENAANTTDY